MRLAICEDNDIERDFLNYVLHKFYKETSIQCEYTLYNRGVNLYYDVMEGARFDIIFLDLFLEDSFGLKIAQKLRELSFDGKIIFCTASADYALESYDVFASGYIVKPYSYDGIKRLLTRFLPEFQESCYTFKQKDGVLYIPFNEIMFVESLNNRCIIHRTDDREYTIYKSLTKIESELNDKRFIRCHQSFIVNMNYIREARDTFVLTNGAEVMIRLKDRKRIHQTFYDYINKREVHT